MASISTVSPSAQTSVDESEFAFAFDHVHALRLPGGIADARAGRFLAHWLARRPLDLTRHVQRINLHVGRADPERLFAALVDLFIALGEHGEALRRRMLGVARPVIDQGRLQCLEQALTDGLSAGHRLGDVPGSVLGRPIGGARDMVTRIVRDAEARPILVDARALVDEGHIIEARSLLEGALADDPADAALAGELLLIYRATRDREGYLACRHMLEEAGTLPPDWPDGGPDAQGRAA